jgi:hypothetical protein
VGEGDPEAGQRLGQRIKQSLPNPFNLRQVVRKGWSGLSSNEEVERAVALLEDRGWVQTREVKNPEGGRPTTEIWINPALLEEAKGQKEKNQSSETENRQNRQNPDEGCLKEVI